jgi:DNA helicase II / ATP-dependent DNA helicase PcrA
VSLARIINTPSRGIGDKAQAALEAHAAVNNQPLIASLRQAPRIPELSAIARTSVEKFLETIDAWTHGGTFLNAGTGHADRGGGSLRELVERVLRESGLEHFYRQRAKAAKSDADEERLDNLGELVSSAAEFELEYDISADPANDASQTIAPPLLAMLRAYLESVALVSDADRVDPDQGAVTLMTLHASKGLEFAAVAVVGLEEGTLPHSRANDSEASLEEERRLCFVGLTRAMRRLLVTSARYRTNRGIPERTIPSRFLGELPAEHVAISDQAGEDWNAGGGKGEVRYERDEFDQTVVEPRRAGEAAGWNQTADGPTFKVGTRVRHPQFGLGEVLSITVGINARAQIRFRDAGLKTLLLQYARLTPVK